MSDELTIRRQAKCASRPQGHTFTQETYGVCSNCLLKVDPPTRSNTPLSGEKVRCSRCKQNVLEFLFVGDDHPVMLDHPMTIYRTDFPDKIGEAKVTVHAYINTQQMCSDVHSRTILELEPSMPLEEAVHTAIGAASTCWVGGTGDSVFDDVLARQVSAELIEYIKLKSW